MTSTGSERNKTGFNRHSNKLFKVVQERSKYETLEIWIFIVWLSNGKVFKMSPNLCAICQKAGKFFTIASKMPPEP